MEHETEVLSAVEERWPDPNEGPWTLRLTFGIVRDRPAIVAVEVYAADPEAIRAAMPKRWPGLALPPLGEAPITSTGIRIPLAEKLAEYVTTREVRDRLISKAPTLPKPIREQAAKRLRTLERSKPEPRGPGRPPQYGDEHFEKVAAIYTAALRLGDPPTLAVAEDFVVSKSTAAKWIARAREKGLLPETAQGKAAAWPADKTRRKP